MALGYDFAWDGVYEYAYVKSSHTLNYNATLPQPETLILLDNLTIPSGKTFTLNAGTTIQVADGKKIEVSGTMNTANGASFSCLDDGGTEWSGIDIKSGGLFDVDGPITIYDAYCAIDIADSSGILNGQNKITISNCSNCGIFINNCSPIIRNVEFNYAASSQYGNAAIYSYGSSSNPVLKRITVTNSESGVKIANNSDATVDSCDFQASNDNHIIQVNINAGTMDLNCHNNFCPDTGKKAINNYSTSDSIHAQNNYWGVASPADFDDLITFKDRVYYSPYSGSAHTVGSFKIAEPQQTFDMFLIAQEYEFSGNWQEALTIYKNLIGSVDNPGNIGMFLRLFLLFALIWYGLRFIGKLITALLKEFSINEPSEQVHRRSTNEKESFDLGINKKHAEDAEYEDID